MLVLFSTPDLENIFHPTASKRNIVVEIFASYTQSIILVFTIGVQWEKPVI